MRRARLGLLLVVALLLAAGLAVAVVHHCLSSPQVAARVTQSLEAQYGAPAEVGQAEIGLQESSLHGLKLYEVGASRSDTPWVTVDGVRADVSALGLAAGQDHPTQVTLTGAAVTLRYDAAGHLLTRLPSPQGKAAVLPEVTIRDSRLTIRQEGRPDFVVSGVNARVERKDGTLLLTGDLHDPHWGHWELGASYATESGSASATVKNAGIHLGMQELRDLPFIGANVWQQVQVEGDTPVELNLRNDATGSVHCRVALQPTNTAVYVNSIDLHADRASGNVVIDDRVVRLKGVKGRTADGDLGLDAVLDFRLNPNRLTFHIDADGLALKDLPKKWRIPSHLSGRLSGHADLVVTLIAGKAYTAGDGDGEVTDIRIVGVRHRPVGLHLHADERGFHYTTTPGRGSRLP